MKFIVLLAFVVAAAVAHEHKGWGWGGHESGHGHGHGGWGWKQQYHGWANVKAHQTPHSYNFGLHESGKGYNKYVYQGADTHHEHPVKHGWGWGGH